MPLKCNLLLNEVNTGATIEVFNKWPWRADRPRTRRNRRRTLRAFGVALHCATHTSFWQRNNSLRAKPFRFHTQDPGCYFGRPARINGIVGGAQGDPE